MSDSFKQMQDAVFAVMPEATRDQISKIKLDGMFGGGSSEFCVELVDDSLCAFEAKQNHDGGLTLLSPIRWLRNNGGWPLPTEAPAIKVKAEEITPGWWWARCKWNGDLEVVHVKANMLREGIRADISGTEEPYDGDKLLREYDLVSRIPEPSS